MLGYIAEARERCQRDGYGILAAHHAKHAAVCWAILAADPAQSDPLRQEHLAKAKAMLAEAVEFFSGMGLIKPQLICQLFAILIDGLEQPAVGIAQRLLSLADQTKGYYPRVAFDALVFARMLGQVLDQPAEVVRQSEHAIAAGAFLRNPLRDRQREHLYQSITGTDAA